MQLHGLLDYLLYSHETNCYVRVKGNHKLIYRYDRRIILYIIHILSTPIVEVTYSSNKR